jgi:hypothetical protein
MADMVSEASYRQLIAWWRETQSPEPFKPPEAAEIYSDYANPRRYAANVLLVMARHGWAKRIGTWTQGASVRVPIYILTLPEDIEANPPWALNNKEGWGASELRLGEADRPVVFDFTALEETGWMQTRKPLKCPKPSYSRKMVYHRNADPFLRPVYSMHILDHGHTRVEHVYDELLLRTAQHGPR